MAKKKVVKVVKESDHDEVEVQLSPSEQAAEDYLARLHRERKSDDKRLSAKEGEFQKLLADIADCAERLPAPPPFKERLRGKKPVAEPVLLLSDWHIGDVVLAEETEGFGEFNYEIALRRITHLMADFLHYIKGQRTLYNINSLQIFVLGDMISGGLRADARASEEWPVPQQVDIAGKLLGRMITDFGKHFAHVHTTFLAADNHSRIFPKPITKHKAWNSWGYLVGKGCEAVLPKDPRYTFALPQGMQTLVEVQGTRFLLMHGDTIKSWAGIPYYGLERRVAQEAVMRMRTDKEFDIMVLGHFHTSVILPKIIMNGALQGITEYDKSCGRHGRPCQVSFLVHPKHGVYNITQWWL